MIYVIAGTEVQAYEYINRKLQERISNGDTKIDDYKYVHDANVLRGIEDPHGVFIGTWRARKDIRDIVSILMTSTRAKNQALNAIWMELNEF